MSEPGDMMLMYGTTMFFVEVQRFALVLSWLLRISVPKPGSKRSYRKSDPHLAET
jgi:hypothetical protein